MGVPEAGGGLGGPVRLPEVVLRLGAKAGQERVEVVFGQDVAQGPREVCAGGTGTVRGLVDEVVGAFPPDGPGQRDHVGFRHDEAAVAVEIGAHAAGVDPEPAQEDDRLREGGSGGHGEFGQDAPFGVPFAGGSLMARFLGAEQCGGEGAGGAAQPDDALRGDRVDLLRHGRGGAAVVAVGLEHLGDLGPGEIDDVAGQARAGRGEQGAQPAELGDSVAGHVPGGRGVAQAEQTGHAASDGCRVGAERGRGAAGSGQGDHADARCGLGQALPVAGELGKEGGQGGPERRGDGLLAVGAGRHHGGGVLGDTVGEDITEFGDPAFERGQGADHLQGETGVHDVLRGGAVVHPAVGSRREPAADLPDQAQDGVADGAGSAPQLLAVDVVRLCRVADGVRLRAGEHSGFGLGPGEGAFGGEPAVEGRVLAEEGALFGVLRESAGQGEGFRRRDRRVHDGSWGSRVPASAGVSMATYFCSRYSSMPELPPSRPAPECLMPPKGAPGSET